VAEQHAEQRRLELAAVPRALAWIILAFGATFLVTGLVKAHTPIPPLAWRPLVAILASIALFAVLFGKLGLIAACVGSVVVAGAATSPVRWLQLLTFGVVIAALTTRLATGIANRRKSGRHMYAITVIFQRSMM